MGLFTPRCPVPEREQGWIEESLAWFEGQFGAASVRRTVVLPTAAFFPGPYDGSEADVLQLVHRVCGFMDVDPARIDVDIVGEPDGGEVPDGLPQLAVRSRGAAGHYQQRDDKALITIARNRISRPAALVATIAHELAHERLLGEGRIAPDRADHEPLTDLLTVHLGLGILTANAAFEFTQRATGWQRRTLGYLNQPMFGYALACWTLTRGETSPAWAQHLTTNPRSYLKQGLRYLHRHTDGPHLPTLAPDSRPG